MTNPNCVREGLFLCVCHKDHNMNKGFLNWHVNQLCFNLIGGSVTPVPFQPDVLSYRFMNMTELIVILSISTFIAIISQNL